MISIRSLLLVCIQFAMIAAICLEVRASGISLGLVLLFLFGVGLGIWSIVSIRIGNFHISPDVSPDARLIVHGPYRNIRHPMYTSVLCSTLSIVLTNPTMVTVVSWLVLLVDLIVKLRYEEMLLRKHFQPYDEYTEKTWRLIPFLY